MKWKNVEETLRGAETPLFWVGAFTVASLALWLVYRLLSGFRIWVLGNGKLLSPKLGKWAGELGSHPRQRVKVSKSWLLGSNFAPSPPPIAGAGCVMRAAPVLRWPWSGSGQAV